jgi:hypothetical protein
MEPPAPKKTAEQVVKEHARQLFSQAVSDLRSSMLNAQWKGEKVVMSDQQHQELYQSFADKSIRAANTFRLSWNRVKGKMFPKDDK